MAELLIARREGFDVDDTIVGRELITQLIGSLRGRIGYSIPGYTLNTLPVLDHTPVDVPTVNRAALWFHQRRVVIPGVAERLRTKASQGIEVYALSGRPATVEWHNTTVDQFVREGIPIPGTRIILTPSGVSTSVSKAEAIQALGIEEFSDDNLKTLLYLAQLFPDRVFNWIRYGLTDIPARRVLLESQPNIREIPINKWMQR